MRLFQKLRRGDKDVSTYIRGLLMCIEAILHFQTCGGFILLSLASSCGLTWLDCGSNAVVLLLQQLWSRIVRFHSSVHFYLCPRLLVLLKLDRQEKQLHRVSQLSRNCIKSRSCPGDASSRSAVQELGYTQVR